MGTNTLTSRSGGDVIPSSDHNELVEALSLDLVPRSASRVPTDIAGQLGTSAYRWLRVFAQEYFIGDAANNLRVSEPSSGQIKIGNANDDFLLITDGSVEFWTNNTIRFRLNDSGIDWSITNDKQIPREKLENKNYVQSSIFSATESGSWDTKEDFNFNFVQGRVYMVAILGAEVGFTGTGTGRVRLRVDGSSLETYPAISSHCSIMDTYTHSGSDATLNVDVQIEVDTGTGVTFLSDVRLICWEL